MSFPPQLASSALVFLQTASTAQVVRLVCNAQQGTISTEAGLAQVAALLFPTAFTARAELNALNVKEDTISME